MTTMIMTNTHKSRKDQYTSSKAVVCGVEYCELQSRASFGSGLLITSCLFVQNKIVGPFRTRKKVIDLHFSDLCWSVA